jgi:hypothetical protein
VRYTLASNSEIAQKQARSGYKTKEKPSTMLDNCYKIPAQKSELPSLHANRPSSSLKFPIGIKLNR